MITTDIYTIQDGAIVAAPHAGQFAALDSSARFILVLAGLQSGKTVTGPIWLYNEIQNRGAGDYLVASPSFPLLNKKALPAFREYFERDLKLGEYKAGAKTFEFSKEGNRRTHGDTRAHTTIFFGHAQDPDSLESATAKAAWLDEAGQNKFKLESWEAIQGRLSIHQGRALITTTPYNMGWLKTQF